MAFERPFGEESAMATRVAIRTVAVRGRAGTGAGANLRSLHGRVSAIGNAAVMLALLLVGCTGGAAPRGTPVSLEKGENEIAPKALDAGGRKAEARAISGFTFVAKNAQGHPEYRHEQTGVIFVLLPCGKFQMGSPAEEPVCAEGPVHEVTLSPFLIAKYEMTQGVWEKVMGRNPSEFKQGEDYPVETVSWDDCQEFCRRTGLKLPSEAQWEYACRAGTSTPSAFGVTVDCVYWAKTTPVGSFEPNAFGLYDMLWNVGERCEDVYVSGLYSKPEARGPDPVFTTGSECRVSRGGSCLGDPGYFLARRSCGTPDYRDFDLGFRPAFFPLP